MTDRTFDRRLEVDERNALYPIRRLAGGPRTTVLPERSWSWRYVQLDQGTEGACVGFACTMEAAATPKPWFGDPWYDRDKFSPTYLRALDAAARTHYREAQLIDPWPETPPEEGTSELAGLKIGVQRGYWGSYLWADPDNPERAADEVFWAVGHRGPVILSGWWRTGMDVDSDGYMSYSGTRLGGHCFLATRVSIRTKRNAVWVPNSWGGEGQGWLRRPHLAAFLADGGTAALVQDRKRPLL